MGLKDRPKEILKKTGYFECARDVLERGRAVRKVAGRAPIPIHNSESYRPFFIVGSGRCGTTLLRRILMSGNEVHIPPENWNLNRVIFKFRRYRYILDWEDAVRWVVNCFTYQGEERSGTELVWETNEDMNKYISKMSNLEDEKKSLSYIINGVYEYNGNTKNCEFNTWGDKYPYNVYFMESILEVFPRAKFVNMIRDGTDVVSSWLELGGFDLEGRAERWRSSMNVSENFKGKYPSKIYNLKYEKLVSNPKTEVKKICEFLDLEFKSSMIYKMPEEEMGKSTSFDRHKKIHKKINSKSVGKGHKKLNKEEKDILARKIGNYLKKYGYEIPK